jgi:hypothetical protein
MVINLKPFGKVHVYKRLKTKTKRQARFTVGWYGHRVVRIGKYDIVLWKVNPIQKTVKVENKGVIEFKK